MTLLLALLVLGCTPEPVGPLEPTREALSDPSGMGTLSETERRSDGRLQLTPGTLSELPSSLAEGLSPDNQALLLTAMNQSYGACADCIFEGVAAGDCLARCDVQERVARVAGALLELGSPDRAVLASLSFAQGWVNMPTLTGPVLGPDAPTATLYVVIDYQSPFSQTSWAKALELQARHQGMAVQPLFWAPERHDHSTLAVRAVLAAQQQGQFLAMHEALIQPQASLERMDLLTLAESMGLDMPAFRAALVDRPQRALILAHQSAALAAGVHGDPCFFLNGWRMRGLPQPEVLDRLYRLEQH